MPAAAAAVGLGYISTALAKPAVWISGLALEGIAGTVHWLGGAHLAGASVADLRVAMPSLAMILASIAALVLAMLAARRMRLAAFAAVALLFGVAGWIAFVPSRPHLRAGIMEMTTIDVGQGDSILLVTPEGRSLLIDAGGLPQWMHSDFDLGEQVVSSYLWNRGIDHLDVVVITHPHADHLGGIPAMIANFHPRELWLSIDKPVGELAMIVAQAQNAGMKVSVKIKKATKSITAARISTCSLPDATKPPDRCGQTTIAWCLPPLLPRRLLCSREMRNVRAELRVVEQHLEAMLLKVAHHGSASGTPPICLRPFIRAMRSFPSAREVSADIPGVKCWRGYTRPR